jgi:ABC-type transporter Mla subunit MlaD
MIADLEKIITTDRHGQEAVAQAQQEALALKSQADAQVRESQAQLQEELAQLRLSAQTEILQEAEARVREIAAATARQVQELTENFTARREEAVVLLVARVLGT